MNQRKSPLIAKFLCSLSVVLYALSFFLPSFAADNEINYGYEAFCLSLMIVFNQFLEGLKLYFIAWLANPMLWVGLHHFVMGRYKWACVAGAIATAMAATVLVGDPDRRDSFLIGYYAWTLSMIMLTLAAVVNVLNKFVSGLKMNDNK